VSTRRDAVFAGERINATEHSTALHTALRVEPMADLAVVGSHAMYSEHVAPPHARRLD